MASPPGPCEVKARLSVLGDSVPDTDHISRYVPKRHLAGTRVTGVAFKLKTQTGETYLSVNWLELLSVGDRNDEIAEIRRLLASKLTIHRKDKLAVGQVRRIRENVRTFSADRRLLNVLHEPEAGDPSHTGVYGLHVDDDLMYGELIAEVCQETHAARVGEN